MAANRALLYSFAGSCGSTFPDARIVTSLLAGQGGVQCATESDARRLRRHGRKDTPLIYKNTWQIACQFAAHDYGLVAVERFPVSVFDGYGDGI